MRAWVALALLVALASAPSFADPVAANAWGWNLSGQLGDGSPLEKRLEPYQIGGLDTAVAVDGGNAHSLALSSDHTLWAWGSNLRGQIGDGTNDERRSPVVVPDLTEVTAIAAGYQHSLALRSDGTLWSWGANQYGQLGDGANTNRNAPVQVVGLPLAKAVAAGGHFYSSHTLAVAQDGTVWAWGRNAYGQLGDGTTSDRFTPVQVTGLTDVVAVAAGSEFSLALRADHTVWAWGRNNYGQLGDGTTTNRSAPVQAWTVDDAEAIVAGDGHALALRTNHRMWAWGLNTSGQLGDTTTTNKTVPVVSTTITDALGIACGGWHNTVLRSDGTVWGWGGNSNGQLGDGTNADELTPTQIADLSQVASLTSRNERSFAVVMRRPTAIGVSPVETHRGLSVALVAQLGTDEAPLPGRTLHFSVDGTDVGTAVTEADGSAALSYAVPPSTPIGARLVLVQWAGELDYLACRGTGWLWVDGMLTSTYVPDRSGTVAEAITLRGFLRRTSDNAWLGAKTVVFRVDGTSVGSAVTGTTGSSGRADLNWIVADGPVTRAIAAEFAGDADYTGSSGTATLTAQTWQTKMYGANREGKITAYRILKAWLWKMDNSPVAGKSIALKLDGTLLGADNTRPTGLAQIGYTIADGAGAGVRTILAEWAGDGGYLRSSCTNTLTVLKATPYIWVSPRTVQAGGVARLYAYFRRLADYQRQEGRPVSFLIDGTWIADVVTGAGSDAGIARYSYTTVEPPGAHTIRCEFAGDAWVDVGYGEANLTIY